MSSGELGDGTANSSSTPVVVSMPAGVTATAVAAGADHSVALGSNGSVYDWGYNGFGQLGDGTTNDSKTPVKVTLPAGVTPTAVAAGQYMTEILDSAGDVYAWGDGAMGELGDGKVVNEESPIQVNVSGVTAIAAGGYHSLVISLGSVFAYGYGGLGQLGNGGTGNASTAGEGEPPDRRDRHGGVGRAVPQHGHRQQRKAVCVGEQRERASSATGRLTNESTPVVVSMPAGVTPTAIADGAEHSFAIGSNGNLYGWGYNGLGELGNGTTSDSSVPVAGGAHSGGEASHRRRVGQLRRPQFRHRTSHTRPHDDNALDVAVVGQLRPDGDDHRHA